MSHVIAIGDDELTIEEDAQFVSGTEQVPDTSWRKRDSHGHLHYYGDTYGRP